MLVSDLEAVRFPFLEPLLPEGLERGKSVAVFFEPSSEWKLIVSATIASRLTSNLRAGIVTTTRFPKDIHADLARFGVDVQKASASGMLQTADWYTWTTGRVPTNMPDDMSSSLKVEELGLLSRKYWHTGRGSSPERDPGFVEFALFDNLVRMFSYNESSACVKFLNTLLARMKQDTRAVMCGFATGILEKREYSNLESMFDGSMDVQTLEQGGAVHTIVRVRSFPEVRHTKGWYAISAQHDAVTLVPASRLGVQFQRASTSAGDGGGHLHAEYSF